MAMWTPPEQHRMLLLSTLLLLMDAASASESSLVEVLPLGLDKPAAELGQWEGYCRTGCFGARERWVVVTTYSPLLTQQLQYEQERGSRKPVNGDFTFANLDQRNVISPSPPCYEMTKKLLKLQMAQLSSTEDRFDKQLGRYVFVNVRSPFSHSYDWNNDATSYHATREVPQTQAHEELHHPALSVTIEDGEHNGIETTFTISFAFQSCVDTIDVVVQLLKEEVDSVGIVHLLANASAIGQLLQEESDLLNLLLPRSLEASWTSAFSLHDWELLRQKTPEAGRKALAARWMDMAEHSGLLESGLVTRVNCLRRALVWYPGFVPAYLALATYLNQPDASCLIMEKILEHADPAEFHTIEMHSMLTTYFPHCSTVLCIANLWETNALFRYLIAFSVVFSTIRVIWIMGSFVQETCQWSWRSEK